MVVKDQSGRDESCSPMDCCKVTPVNYVKMEIDKQALLECFHHKQDKYMRWWAHD